MIHLSRCSIVDIVIVIAICPRCPEQKTVSLTADAGGDSANAGGLGHGLGLSTSSDHLCCVLCFVCCWGTCLKARRGNTSAFLSRVWRRRSGGDPDLGGESARARLGREADGPTKTRSSSLSPRPQCAQRHVVVVVVDTESTANSNLVTKSKQTHQSINQRIAGLVADPAPLPPPPPPPRPSLSLPRLGSVHDPVSGGGSG